MTDDERRAAVDREFTAFQKRIATEYGAQVMSTLQSETMQSASGGVLQVRAILDVGLLPNWTPPAESE